jgi:hypothetical protein
MKHRVQVTVTDPNHPMVSKRTEKIQKFVRISGDQSTAVARARTHFKNQGYRVHGAEHVGTVQEAVKDKFDIGEYDQEGDMAKSDLRSIIMNAKRVHDMLQDSDNLPEWVQSKITKAEDYISTVANYMQSEMAEETQIEEAWNQGNRNPQRGIKVGDKVRSYDFPGMHDDHYIEGHVVADNPHTYHIRVNRVVRGGKEILTPAHMAHVEAPKGRGMFSNAYAVHKMMAKQQQVTAAPEVPQGAARTFSNLRKKS